ncbi:hypothetical protein [Aquabacterium sp.]|uniref:hypothetical protein n=1 Tax=Aquabacterium sp. TaxID=1872578 RepID=UPI0025BA58CB|nr:hypothetical protein [Aquabacterium sp.]
MKLKIPTNPTRLANAMVVRAARAGVITHPVVKSNLAAGQFAKQFHPANKG